MCYRVLARGLKKEIYNIIRVHDIDTLADAISKAAKVSGKIAHTTPAPHAPAANAINNIQSGGDERTTQQQQYPRGNRGTGRGGYRGGRGFNRGAEGQRPPSTTVPLVPHDVREKRREQGVCFRCGQSGHMARACPNAVSASLN